MPRVSLLIAACLWAALSLCAAPARATVFCVGSVADLQQAFGTAFTDGTDDEIRLQVGHYVLPSTLAYYASAPNGDSLNFSGGWISFFGACDKQFPDASLTLIDGSGGASLKFLMQGSNPAPLYLFNFSLVNAGTTSFDSAGLSVGAPASPNLVPDLYIGNVIVDHCQNVQLDCGLLIYGSVNLRLRNILVADGASDRTVGIAVDANNSGSVVMNHVTVVNNRSYGLSYPGIYMNVPGSVTISNSILWGNQGQYESTTCDVISLSGNPKLVNTTFGKACSTLDGASSGLSNADPLFAGADDYRLAPQSPAIDSGVANPLGGLIAYDLDAHPRTDGAKPDRGAYEFADSIFSSPFE